MSAVWRAARAAVRRRRLQTVVIGLVVLLSTATVVVALSLLNAASAPFDHVFSKQHGAHVVADFDAAKVPEEQLAGTAHRPGVAAAAGPYGEVSLPVTPGGADFVNGPLTVVGRDRPAGPVDQVDLWDGRWATAPGELVVAKPPPVERGNHPFPLGAQVLTPSGQAFTIVGYAYSVSQSADAWVSPEQMATMHPTGWQMLYRFSAAGNDSAIDAGLASVTHGLPSDALRGSQSYLVVKKAIAAGPGVFIPFMMVFGFLGIAVAVLIVANVISGAVLSGSRHIGILKSIGFTPRQVVAVYLLMVSVPAVVGCVLGTTIGGFAVGPLLSSSFSGMGLDVSDVGVSPLVLAGALVGMPAMVLLAAFVPAARAHGLSAAEAISAGSAPRTGHGLRVQRRLGRTRLPRAVSLGLGMPFARLGRTALTLASVLLGVTTVTFATGLVGSVTNLSDAATNSRTVQMRVLTGDAEVGETTTDRTDEEIDSLLRSLPGIRHLTADVHVPLALAGSTDRVTVEFLRGDSATLGLQGTIVDGHWLQGPGELVVSSAFLNQHGLAVGDAVTLELAGKQNRVTVVGSVLGSSQPNLYADWSTLAPLSPITDRVRSWVQYQVELAPGVSIASYSDAVRAADPGLYPKTNDNADPFAATVIGLSSTLTLMLGTVAALGVFNTVVLNARERRRDLGMLKSIGMTPGQVITMMVVSMAAVGAVAGVIGIPLGVIAHRLIVPATAHAAQMDLPRSALHVWNVPVLVLLSLAGVVITVLGAFFPARSAARMTIARVLHSE